MTADARERAASVDEVVDLFVRFGADPYDEELAQTEHALQTAALADRDGSSPSLIAAALLHDVGHLLALRDIDGTGAPAVSDEIDLGHETTGARWLAGLYGPAVTGPIALHVRAKRYLAAIDADYHDGLSIGSTRSLVRQGGPMDVQERTAFEANPGFRDAVALRRWDDAGKVDGLAVPSLDHYRDLLDRLASEPTAAPD